MRRGFSIFLIVFFGLGPLSALLEASEDANLAPCCRRHGAHHCAMAMRMAAMMAKTESGSTPVLTAPMSCPLYPGTTFSMLMPAHALTATPASVCAALIELAGARSRTHGSALDNGCARTPGAALRRRT